MRRVIAIGERWLPLLAASVERIRLAFAPGRTLLDRGHAASAVVSLRRAVYLDPDVTRAPFALARTNAAKRTLCAQPAVSA